ncbi:MAG: heme lyase CcmF/NrfE family subunit, partial [Deltaproteobacteria bacterium]
LGWRKTSKALFYKSFAWPLATMGAAIGAHLALGERWGFAPFVESDPLFVTWLGLPLAWLQGKLPLITVGLVAFNLAVVAQEVVRGVRARRRKSNEGVATALVKLISKSRRRYGGYVVHVGVALMFLGFAGRSWGVEKEASLKPGEQLVIEEYELTYLGHRSDADREKTIDYADMAVKRHGQAVGRLSPAKFTYRSSPERPTSEVARYITVRNDLYVVVGMISGPTGMASFEVHVNPLVSFVWLGIALLIVGATIAMWPELSRQPVGALRYLRAFGSVVALLMLALLLTRTPAAAAAHEPSPQALGANHRGTG